MNRRGLTLIELLVALFLASLVAFFAFNLMHDEGSNFTKTREKVKLQADGKDAVRILEGEIRNMGYNDVISTASPTAASVAPCAVASEDARIDVTTNDSSSFQYVNSNAVPGGDQVVFLYHQPAGTGGLTNCTTDALTSIGYRYNAGALERRFCSGAAAKACNAAWIPLLENVMSFHAQYGVLRRVNDLLYNQTYLIGNANWTGSLTGAVGADSAMTITNFAVANRYLRVTTAVDSFLTTQTYLVSFRVRVNAKFLSNNGSFVVGFLNAAGNPASATDTLRVYPGVSATNNYRTITLLFTPQANSIAGTYFGIIGRTPTVAGAPELTIRDIAIRRSSRGGYMDWIDAPSVAQKNLVKSVRLSLLVRSPRQNSDPSPGTFSADNLGAPVTWTPPNGQTNYSYLLFQRIIPVVNNGSDY